MKALVIAAALAALSSIALASAAREARSSAADAPTVVAMADAKRMGSTSLTALNTGSHWQATQRTDTGADFNELAPEIDGGTLLITCGVIALLLARPLSRALRRLEQQRRAAALASTLGPVNAMAMGREGPPPGANQGAARRPHGYAG